MPNVPVQVYPDLPLGVVLDTGVRLVVESVQGAAHHRVEVPVKRCVYKVL